MNGIEQITVSNCPRCGKTHEKLPIKRLSKETFDGYTHWAVCPDTKDPVLLSFVGGKKANT